MCVLELQAFVFMFEVLQPLLQLYHRDLTFTLLDLVVRLLKLLLEIA